MKSRIKVLLVDDHALVRDTLAARLSLEPSIVVVGSADSADEALRLARRLHPDVVLMDIEMPGTDCFLATRRMRARQPSLHVLILSAHLTDRYVDEAVAAGASGYVTKAEQPATVLRAIQAVAGDLVYFSDEVRFRMAPGRRLDPASRASTLTPREREVLRLLAEGCSRRQVAIRMHVSRKTADKHCQNLMEKLAIHDRVELVRFALREGLARL